MIQISVVMPVYNTKEKYLREAIESILNQTCSDFEFIIINDGSVNNAQEVILSYEDKRITYINNETQSGPSAAINNGIKIARGKYMVRMDSDDISHPQRLEKQLKFMEENPLIDISGTWFLKFPKIQTIKLPIKNDEIKKALLVSHSPIGGATTIFRKSSIEKFDILYNQDYIAAEDLELWLRLIDKVNFANIPEFLYQYRVYNENSSSRLSETMQKLTASLVTNARNKICKFDSEKEIEIMYKLIDKKELIYDEVLFLLTNILLVFNKLNLKFPDLKYSAKSIAIIKNAVMLCKKDKTFIKILFNGMFYKILAYGLIIKLSDKLNFLKHPV